MVIEQPEHIAFVGALGRGGEAQQEARVDAGEDGPVARRGGVVHFVSRGYYFDLGLGLKLWLPELLSPGVTHVEHVDLGHGWFRFTMIVTHPLFGEFFFQTCRFCATEEAA